MSASDLALVLLSALLHAIWSVSIKQSGDPLCFNLLQTWSGSLLLAVAAPWIPWHAIPAPVWGLVLLTGPTHALYLYWMSRAYEHGDLWHVPREQNAYADLLVNAALDVLDPR